jgi:hypothetical protein
MFLSCCRIKNSGVTGQWWLTPLIPALERQRQVDFWVRGQAGLQSEFQDSQGYTEKPSLEIPKPTNQPTNKTQWSQLTMATFRPLRWFFFFFCHSNDNLVSFTFLSFMTHIIPLGISLHVQCPQETLSDTSLHYDCYIFPSSLNIPM